MNQQRQGRQGPSWRDAEPWTDRSADTFRPFAHPEEYERRNEDPRWGPGGPPRPKSPRRPPGMGKGKSRPREDHRIPLLPDNWRERFVPSEGQKEWMAQQEKLWRASQERDEDPQVQDAGQQAGPSRSSPSPELERPFRGYSPSVPAADLYVQYKASLIRGQPRTEERMYFLADGSGFITNEELITLGAADPYRSTPLLRQIPRGVDPFLPEQDYIALSRRPLYSDPPKISPKLLVLDLNGTLCYRTSSSAAPHPRPYLASFLQYLFLPEPMDAYGKIPERPWEAFVWSSAQPHNVRKMVTTTFGDRWIRGLYDAEDGVQTEDAREPGEGRLLGVWARDKLKLSTTDYSRKVQTIKDLRVLLAHLSEVRAQSGNNTPEYDEANTVLLDDSPLKAVHQPWSQLVIPEYDQEEYQLSSAEAKKENPDWTARGHFQSPGPDIILLCVIGILEQLRTVDSVPAFFRREEQSKIPEFGDWVAGVRPVEEEPNINGLPSYPTYRHWYKSLDSVELWRKRGLEALQRKGITAEVGDLDADLRSRSSRSATPAHDRRGGSGPAPPREMPRPLSPSRKPAPPRRSDAPNWRRDFHSSDSWRTFRASDVALYLQDVADRPSSISIIQRQALHNAIEALQSVGPSADWEQEEIEPPRGRVMGCNTCDNCFAPVTHAPITKKERKRLETEAKKEAKAQQKAERKATKNPNRLPLGPKVERAEKYAEVAQAQSEVEEDGVGADFDESEGAKALGARSTARARRERRSKVKADRKVAQTLSHLKGSARDEGAAGSEISQRDDEPVRQPALASTASSVAVMSQMIPLIPFNGKMKTPEQMEADLRTSLAERAIYKALLDVGRKSGSTSWDFHEHDSTLSQLIHVDTRIQRILQKFGNLGISTPLENSGKATIAVSDMEYLAQAKPSRKYTALLKRLGVSVDDFLAGTTVSTGPLQLEFHPSIASSRGRRTRSGSVNSVATSSSSGMIRKREKSNQWKKKKLEAVARAQAEVEAGHAGAGQGVDGVGHLALGPEPGPSGIAIDLTGA